MSKNICTKFAHLWVVLDHTFSYWNNSKLCKFRMFATSHSFFNYFLLIFKKSTVQWQNCTYLKYELNRSYNGGGVVYLRKSEASHSSLQYIKTCALSFDDGSHYNFHSYTKNNFLRNVYTQKAKKSILFTYGIPRALLSNKIVFLHFCKKSIIQ